MNFWLLVVTISLLLTSAFPNPVLNFQDHTKLVREIDNARLYLTNAIAPETGQEYTLPLLHLWGGDYYAMGYAQGRILWESINEVNTVIPTWFELSNLAKESVNSALPQDIQDIMNAATGPDISTAMFIALDWVYETQLPYITKALVDFDAEIRGVADGFCAEMQQARRECDPKAAYKSLRSFQMFPELVRMGCTITQSWGIAHSASNADIYAKMQDSMRSTLSELKSKINQKSFEEVGIEPGQDLIQSRLLDFGAFPLVNTQILMVRHFDNFASLTTPSQPFYSLSFPGHVTVITSGSDIMTQSQKVWLDFIDRADGSSHAPTLTSSHQSARALSEHKRKEMLINKHVHEAERTYSHADIITANFRAVPLEQRRKMIEETMRKVKYAKTQPFQSEAQISAALARLLTKVNSRAFLVDSNSDVEKWFKRIASPSHKSRENANSSSSLTDFRPGSYDGLADVFSIRQQIEKSSSLDRLIEITNATPRTWPIFLGFGTSLRNPAAHAKIDGISTPGVIMAYENEVHYLRDETIPMFTEKPVLNNIIMVDRRPQPSPADASLHPLLAKQYGKLTIDWILQNVAQKHASADVHGVWFDHNTNAAYISVGKLNDDWEYETDGKASARPWMRYNWDILFAEKCP